MCITDETEGNTIQKKAGTKNMSTDTIIGIDLGTSTTEAAIIRNGKPEMILNFDGEVITPSVVGVDADKNFIF